MSFNHYAKLKRILEDAKPGWYIERINKPTSAVNFSGHKIEFSHYYRIYTKEGEAIKYCKFQQIDRLAKILETTVEKLPVKTTK